MPVEAFEMKGEDTREPIPPADPEDQGSERTSAEPNLDAVWEPLRDSCLEHAKDGDFKRMIACAANGGAMAFLIDNAEWFRARGVFEEAMLLAWNTQRFTHGYQNWMRIFLALADREKLMAASEPLPQGDRFTVYRGVSKSKLKLWGKTLGGDKRCISWTLDPEVARRFAGLDGIGGTVYATEVSRDQIYAYLGGKGNRQGYRPESEVLLLLDRKHPVRVHEKIRAKRTASNSKPSMKGSGLANQGRRAAHKRRTSSRTLQGTVSALKL